MVLHVGFKDRLREVARQMEANQVPYAIKICSKMDPEKVGGAEPHEGPLEEKEIRCGIC